MFAAGGEGMVRVGMVKIEEGVLSCVVHERGPFLRLRCERAGEEWVMRQCRR